MAKIRLDVIHVSKVIFWLLVENSPPNLSPGPPAMIRARVAREFKIRRHSTKVPGKGPMSLPRLPVPDLSKTLTRYLASLEPLLLEDEKRGGTPYKSSYTLRQKWAQEFEVGIGQLLQDRLLGPFATLLYLLFDGCLISQSTR